MQWVDEDEQDGDANDPLSSYNFGAGGMPDMGDLDFSKLGGGMGDAAAGLGGGDDDDDEDSDEEMPDLTEDVKEKEVEGKGKEPATS